MSGLNRQGLNEEGPMTGRGMGECKPAEKSKMNNEIYEIWVGLAVVLIIGVTKIAGIWMNERRLKSEN